VKHRLWLIVAVLVVSLAIAVVGLRLRRQSQFERGSQAWADVLASRHPPATQPPDVIAWRTRLYEMLQPVALANCDLERFGEPNDGGYLMCGNLLGAVRAGYSYGISGYDGWGCQISRTFDVPVHQYDCFDTTEPSCAMGQTLFHAECVGDTGGTFDGRVFDTIESQLARNGDRTGSVVMKMDIEGAEWDSLLAVPDDILARIDQLAIEFHWLEDDTFTWIDDERYLQLVDRLKTHFEVAHLHFNNYSCVGDLAPFPAFAYEALFVNKRLAEVDAAAPPPTRPEPPDAPNDPWWPDCQSLS